MPKTEKDAQLIRGITFYRVIATNFLDGLFPSESLYPSEDLYPSDGVSAYAISPEAKITIYPEKRSGVDTMIKFTDPRLYLKGVGNVVLTDPDDGNILYQSDKFTTGQVTSSLELGEIRAGIGMPIVAMLPNNAGVTVDFSAADFDFFMKAARSGATVSYGAPVPACQTVLASGTSISIDVSTGTPVANSGMSEVQCYVQHVGEAGLMSATGVPYALDASSGAVTGFTAVSGEQYKVWYFVNKGTAAIAKLTTLMKPRVVHFMAQFPVYENATGKPNAGTMKGNLYVVIPRLALNPDGSVNGDNGTADTTSITGQALAYSGDVVSATCDECGEVGSDLAYYIYSPCSDADVVRGLVVVGGVVAVTKSTTAQIPVRLLMPDNSLSVPTSYSEGFTYTPDGLPSGTTVSNSGLISAGSTTGDGEVEISLEVGEKTFTTVLNVEVTA